MSLITRTAKGSKLTIADMDGNLTYLESNGFVDGEYSQEGGTGDVLEMNITGAGDSQEGTYTNISPTGGSGTGLVVNVEITEDRGELIANFEIINGGTGYKVNDNVTIQISEVGGTTGEITIGLLDGQVDEVLISLIRVKSDEILLESEQILLTGEVTITGNISNATNISANGISANGISANVIQVGFTNTSQLSVNSFTTTPTTVNFSNLPTSDPGNLGQLWNDSGSLKISEG